MILQDFDVSHLDGLQALERNWRQKVSNVVALAQHGYAASMVVNDHVVACGGLVPVHADRLIAWSLVTADMPLVAGVRLFRAFLDEQDALRIETTVDCEDGRSQRWLRMLGFVRETPPLRGFNRDGSAAYLYVRLRDGA